MTDSEIFGKFFILELSHLSNFNFHFFDVESFQSESLFSFFKRNVLFSHGHATLQLAVSVSRSVGWSVSQFLYYHCLFVRNWGQCIPTCSQQHVTPWKDAYVRTAHSAHSLRSTRFAHLLCLWARQLTHFAHSLVGQLKFLNMCSCCKRVSL